jgi:D-glycero-D-manno-heptose 1,7-bisphosphate phosphatase
MHKAIFIDKDGTMVENMPYNTDPENMTLMEGALPMLAALDQAGYKLIIITNQSGIARGFFEESAIVRLNWQTFRLLKSVGITLTDFYYCPHHPDGAVSAYRVRCLCRKPMPGMLLQAAREHEIDLGASWMIGDILDDVEAGKRSRCKTVLFDHGSETEWVINANRTPDFRVARLEGLENLILSNDISADLMGMMEGYER